MRRSSEGRVMRPVPRGLFAPGGEVNEAAAQSARPIVPLEWLISHPATVPWWSKGIRTGIAVGFVTDDALQLEPSFEGVAVFMKLIGQSDIQQTDAGTNWALLVNKVPMVQARRRFGFGTDEGLMDDLGEGDAAGNTWGEVRFWFPEGALVQVTYNNNSGSAAQGIGWLLRGYYWPVAIREEWLARGWRK